MDIKKQKGFVKIKALLFAMVFLFTLTSIQAQSPLDIAEDFMVKDTNGETHTLFSILDDEKIVVLTFFTTT
ncbi:MAG: hypothetical protein GQ527_03320 [Bacteroidales bacterium]|nr:hypothetical protein [Bacteroidales bacterium]